MVEWYVTCFSPSAVCLGHLHKAKSSGSKNHNSLQAVDNSRALILETVLERFTCMQNSTFVKSSHLYFYWVFPHTHTHNKDGRLEIVVVTAYANFEGLYVKFCEHVIFMALKLLWLTSILICSGFSRTLPP